MRERGTIMSGTSKVDDVIGQAQATAAALVNQREIFQNVNRNLDAIGSRFPMVNNLLQAIRRKRSKDTMVLATVVAICTAFLARLSSCWYSARMSLCLASVCARVSPTPPFTAPAIAVLTSASLCSSASRSAVCASRESPARSASLTSTPAVLTAL